MDKFWKEYKGIIFLVIIFYVLYKLKDLFNLFGKPDNSQTGGSEDVVVEQSNLSYPDNWYLQQADIIEQAVWAGSALWEDDDAIQNTLLMCMNDDDFYQLSNAYGVRGRGVVLRDYYNLQQTVQEYLDDDNKEAVNANYASKGMTTRV